MMKQKAKLNSLTEPCMKEEKKEFEIYQPRILIVDDNFFNTEALEQIILEQYPNANIKCCFSGIEAVKRIEEALHLP